MNQDAGAVKKATLNPEISVHLRSGENWYMNLPKVTYLSKVESEDTIIFESLRTSAHYDRIRAVLGELDPTKGMIGRLEQLIEAGVVLLNAQGAYQYPLDIYHAMLVNSDRM